jgi:outer membrane lipase/esterase
MKSAGSRGLVCASILVAGATLLPMIGEARAQTVFTTIQAFGDSYADTGNLIRAIGPITIAGINIYPTGRFSGGTNFVDTTSALLGIPQNNFAVGGAQTAAGPIPNSGFVQQAQGFVASGRTIAPSDLVEISIGGNDARGYYQAGGTLAGVPAAATVSANQAMAGINTLVGAGARNIVFTVGDVSQLPEAIGNPNAPVGSAYSQNYNAQMQAALAAIARNGVRVEYIDNGLLGNLIRANPARYGISNVGPCPFPACVGTTAAAKAIQDQFLFYLDGIHLTSHGFAIMGGYIVNRLNAPLTFAPQGDLALNSAMGFASTLYGKLDMFRETYGLVSSSMNAYAAYTKAPYLKAPPPAPVNPWSFYMQANGGISDRQATVASNGFNLDGVGGTIGTEYRINNNAFVGGAFDYSNPKARLFNNAGTTDVNSYQFGVYGAWADAHFFAQGLATFGWQNFRNTRPGVVDVITSNPDGTTFVAGGKVGYLFDAGQSQVGPIGGLTYARARVNGYTESGDPVLTLNVGAQTAEALVASAGVQFRAPFMVSGRVISPYLNLTAEDDVIGNGRIIQFGATSAPLIINNWAVPNGSSQHVYGRVAGGVVAPVTNNVALTVNLSRTIAHQGGDDFYGTGGLRISF